jgi:hypothetical protein
MHNTTRFQFLTYFFKQTEATKKEPTMSEDKSVQATVSNIELGGKHGPYAVTHNSEMGSITFSLSVDVWSEEDNPEHGEIVMLSEFRKMTGGWRAMKAHRIYPSG